MPSRKVDMGSATLEITALAAGGRGVARREGRVWLVEGGLPGDRLVAEPVRQRPRLVEARATRVLRPGPERRDPPCPVQERCGGCPWMPLAEPAQRTWKRRLVEDALARIGGLKGVPVEQPVPSPHPFAYRNKVEFSLGRDESGRRVLGLHGRPSGIVDVPSCAVQHASADAVLASCRELLSGPDAPRDPWLDDPRVEPRIVIRRSETTGELLVAFRGGLEPFPAARAIARTLTARHPELVGVVRLVASAGRRGGTRTRRLAGRGWLAETLGGTAFRLPAATFFQINTRAAERLVELVRELAGPVTGRRVLDLYAGVGVFGLALARTGARVRLCEADADALRCAARAATDAGLEVELLRADVGEFLRRDEGGKAPELLLANPPRTGFGRGVGTAVARLAARRIVIVSCDPATLARDLGRLVGRGYAVRRVVPVDLFPQTPHVETVVRLDRA